jgi:hypothetical protein
VCLWPTLESAWPGKAQGIMHSRCSRHSYSCDSARLCRGSQLIRPGPLRKGNSRYESALLSGWNTPCVKQDRISFRGSFFRPQVSIQVKKIPDCRSEKPEVAISILEIRPSRFPKFQFQSWRFFGPSTIKLRQESHRPKPDVQVSKWVSDVLVRELTWVVGEWTTVSLGGPGTTFNSTRSSSANDP